MVMPAISQRGLFALLYPNFFILCSYFALVCASCRFFYAKLWQSTVAVFEKRWWQFCITGFLAFLYITIALLVLRFPGYVDPTEPMVAVASFWLVHGTPVYDMVISYGPVCYIPYGIAIKLFGATIGALKAVVAIANVAFVILLILIFKKLFKWPAALLAALIVLSSCLMKQDYLFQARGDLFIYVAVALGLLAATSVGWRVAGVLMVVAITLGCGVKITSVLYLAFPLAIFWKRHGLKLLALVCVTTVILSLLPFASHVLVLSDYINWLSVMSHQPRNRKEFVGNVVTTGLLIVPCILAYWNLRTRSRQLAKRYLEDNWVALITLLLSILVIDVLASKIGAGRHHLVPFFIVAGYISSQIIKTTQLVSAPSTGPGLVPVYLWGCLALLLLMTETSELQDVQALTTQETPQALALADDVRSILEANINHKVELGNGFGEFDLEKSYSPMFSAPQLVFAGSSYTFDPSAQADVEMLHAPMRESELHHLASCASDVWLIPRGQVPFHSISIYSGMYPDRYNGRLLFPASFEKSFLNRYAFSSSSRFFDVYRCKEGTTAER